MDTLRLLSRSSRLKLGADRADFQPTQPVPSAGSKADSEARIGKKRKREELDAENSTNELTESEIRQLQQQHKIKIIDVRKLSKSNKNDSRKGQKEASRLFPKPLQAFKQLKTLASNGALLENVAEQAFKEPTDVQMATIPLLLGNGEKEPDLLTVAPTGSGKTLAFMIPLITKIAKSHQHGNLGDRHVSAIILAPTKELVSQIVNEGRKLSVNTGVRIAEMRKGMRLHGQDQESNDSESSEDDQSDDSDDQKLPSGTVVKSDILVSTPLSLAHALKPKSSGAIKSLPAIRSLILDEADVLLDPLFREQTLAVWDACSSPELRVSLWSATIGASIEELAISKINAHHQSNGVQIATTPLIRTIIGLKDTSLPSISHRLTYASTEAGKLMGLRQLLHPTRSNTKSNSNNNQPSHETTTASDQPLRPPFLIFTQTISRAQSLYDELQYDIPVSAGGSSRIAVLHSSLSSKQRSNTMTAFRQGKIWILITTDLLSRGVDFKGINGVVNYDIPTTAASYVHRAGRTGRAGRQGGIVVTLYTRDDVKYLKPIANIISSSTSTDPTASSSPSPGGLPAWLIPSLPDLTKSSRKDLKARGVQERRAIKSSDLDNERRRKLQNRIGTRSGYEKKLADRKRDMIQGSKRRARGEARAGRGSHDTDDAAHARKGGGDGHGHEDGSDDFVGFGD